MKIPKELRSKVRKYSLMIAWWQLHHEDKDEKDKVKIVLKKIEDTEDELKLSGVSPKVFSKILQRAEAFLAIDPDEMTDGQWETLIKLIFGQDTKITLTNRWARLRPGVTFFDPVKYARWMKEMGKPLAKETKYIKYEHKKALWKGKNVSLRSYIVEKAIKENKGIKVKHGGKIMTLSPEEVAGKGVYGKNPHSAKYVSEGIAPGEEYYLVDYIFTPDK